MKRPRRQSLSCLLALILPALGFLLLAALLVLFLAGGIPTRVQATFGPPAPHLGPLQRLAYSSLLYFQTDDLVEPVNPASVAEFPFRVEPGETVPSITGRLYREGLIGNPGAFRTFLLYGGLDRSIQAGVYTLSPSLSPLEIAHSLQDATPAQITFTILAGWRLEEIAESLPTSGLQFSPAEFLAAARTRRDGYSFSTEIPDPPSLEGFLLPGAYSLGREIDVNEFLMILLDHFEQTLSEDLRRGFSRQGLNTYEAVTLASIVQREAMIESDMPLIASVFYNRLAIQMKLDTDPTVQYALGFNEQQNTWWKNPLSLADLQVDSPYNTYLFPGLPPGPIGSPGLHALRAVAFPAQTPYYYFRAGCQDDGRHLFAETFQEHLNNACP